MAHQHYSWEKLDNSANVFPVIADENMTNTYRIAAVLKENIDGGKLQEALDIVLPKFPGFNLRMRSGIFWYYMEENGKPAPRVHEEDTYPCRYIHGSRNNSYMFRITYYRKRINMEVFHVLADGMGGVTFLRELVYQYLRLLYPELQKRYGDGLSAETSLNREDSFKSSYRRKSKSVYERTRAYLIKGEKLPYDGFGLIHGYLSLEELKSVCKGIYGVSVNEYLVAALIQAIYRTHARGISAHRPVRVAVPVNLRPFFDSITTKNFFVMVSAVFYPQDNTKEYSFDEIAKIVHASLKSQITKENLENIFSYNVSNEDMFIARAVPLPIKNIAIRLIYTEKALANTTTLTNIGAITVLDGYKPYIDKFNCFLSFSVGQSIKASVCSYEGQLAFTFSSAFVDTSIQRETFRQMTKDGIHVTIETNGVFE
ncbi:MAG: hypothetical protein IJT32_00385 [Lachnospiraceae bacterium]|nr:hypothetical protein [Lachnospiraceae bacterium]